MAFQDLEFQNIKATATSNTSITVSWSNPTTQYVNTVQVRSKNDGTYPTSDTDGINVYTGSGESVVNDGLTTGNIYNYRLFAYIIVDDDVNRKSCKSGG